MAVRPDAFGELVGAVVAVVAVAVVVAVTVAVVVVRKVRGVVAAGGL